MHEPSETLLEFPCDYPLKVFGKQDHKRFEAHILTLIQPFITTETGLTIRHNTSKSQKYCALTITFRAQSKQQLDDIYLKLTNDQHVIMAL